MALLAGAALAWGVGRLLGVPELYVVAVAAVAAVVLGALAVRLSTTTVSTRRTVPRPKVVAGEPLDVVVELRNEGRLPAPLLLVEDALPEGLARAGGGPRGGDARFVVPGLPAGGVARLPYRLGTATRGRHEVGPLRLRLRDPLGAVERVRRYTATAPVTVYPRIEPMDLGGVKGSHLGAGSSEQRRVLAAGDEFYTMREYVQGDDLRLVHWPSTARRQVLMVRQQEQPWQSRATVLLDTRRGAHRGGGPSSTFEKAVSVAASALWHLADARYELRLVLDSAPAHPRAEDWEVLLDRLAVVTTSGSRSLAAAAQVLRGGDGLLVAVLTPPPGRGPAAREPDVRSLALAGRTYGERVALVCATAPPDPRAEETSAALRAAGWKAATIAPGEPLQARWTDAVRPRRRVGVAS